MFQIQQEGPYIDTKIKIKIISATSLERYKIKAEMRDNLGVSWISYGEFLANAEGEIDLAVVAPIEGSYEGADAMGLFWSMVPDIEKEVSVKTPLQPLQTTLSLIQNNYICATATITRHVLALDVKREPIRDEGFIGTFFYHNSSIPTPTILVLGGSEGGLREGQAAILSAYGYNALAIAYFGLDGLPEELVEIPLDYVECAINWLQQDERVDSTKIGVLGVSKGGELALLCAAQFPAIKVAIGYVPSGIIYPGISRVKSGVSSWKYNEKPLPFAYGNIPSDVELAVTRSREKKEPIVWREVYRYWADGAVEAEIPIENAQSAILLISGGDDQLWPADLLSERVIERLKSNHYPYTYEHVTFPKAGHAIVQPGYSTSASRGDSGYLMLGGTPQANAIAQYEAWAHVKSFLQRHLKGNHTS